MTRHRKGQRPLSQTGFPRIPASPLQRNFTEGGLRQKRPGALEARNEADDVRQLHPTKGWRQLSVKRDRAQFVMAQIRQGQRMTTAQMGRFIRDGY